MSDWQATFLTPLGDTVSFDDPANGIYQAGEVIGGSMPPIEYVSRKKFDRPGELLLGARHLPREITVPIAMALPDGITLRERMRALSQRLNPTLGYGTLAISPQADPSSGRGIVCRYSSGYEGSLETTAWGNSWQEAALVFHAFDPYWQDLEDIVQTFGPSGDTAVPFFPFARNPASFGPYFGTSSIYTPFSVANAGDALAWPTWRLNGPLTSPVLTNSTTGFVIDLSADGGLVLGDGEWADISTEPGASFVRKFEGTNLFHYLSDGSTLWPLALGDNTVLVDSSGAGSSSRITLSYRQKFLHY